MKKLLSPQFKQFFLKHPIVLRYPSCSKFPLKSTKDQNHFFRSNQPSFAPYYDLYSRIPGSREWLLIPGTGKGNRLYSRFAPGTNFPFPSRPGTDFSVPFHHYKKCLYPTWAGGQDKFSCPQEDKKFPLKRLRAKRAPREREIFFFLRAGKLILPDRPCRIAIPKSYSIASSKGANIKKIRENVEC